MLYMVVTIVVGSLLEDTMANNTKVEGGGLLNMWGFYVWAIFFGIGLGWFYPTENLFFARTITGGAEVELAGFHTFCGQVFSWAPPLVFTLMFDAGINQKYGFMAATVPFYLIAIALLSCTGTWEQIQDEAREGLADKFSREKDDSETGGDPKE